MRQNQFEIIKRFDDNGVEYWSSREIAETLEYSDYRKFLNVIKKAKTACENSGEVIHNHFVHMDEMVNIGSGCKYNNSGYPKPKIYHRILQKLRLH